MWWPLLLFFSLSVSTDVQRQNTTYLQRSQSSFCFARHWLMLSGLINSATIRQDVRKIMQLIGMNMDCIRFNATDGVELQGWLSEASSSRAVLHIHGMSGNGYENRFLDELRRTYNEQSIAFLSINTRGHGVMSELTTTQNESRLGGSCYELFEESLFDIQGALDYLLGLGKTDIVLQGHSLGCSKVVHYMLSPNRNESISKVILLAPTDMVGWAQTDDRHEMYMRKAKELLAEGKGKELVGLDCWLYGTPLSAQTYQSVCEPGGAVDIYGRRDDGETQLGRVELPMLIVYGTADIGIVKIDGDIEAWRTKVEPIVRENTQIVTIDDAPHSFAGHIDELTKAVESFVVV